MNNRQIKEGSLDSSNTDYLGTRILAGEGDKSEHMPVASSNSKEDNQSADKVIPFRISPHPEPNNYSLIYSFLIKGSSKDPYEVEIDVDDFNDFGITDKKCTCPHHVYRGVDCKHIKLAIKILEEFKCLENLENI